MKQEEKGVHIRGATLPCDTWCMMLRESWEFAVLFGVGVWTGDLLVVGVNNWPV